MSKQKKKQSEIRNYITYLCNVVERNRELTVVNLISNDFSRSPFTKSKRSHANLVSDYNLIVLSKLILLSWKSVFHALRNPSVNSNSNFAKFVFPVSQRLQASQLFVFL